MRFWPALTCLVATVSVAQEISLEIENQITRIARERCGSELIEGRDYTISAQANGEVSVRFIGRKGAGLDGSFVYKKEEWSGQRKVAVVDQLEKDRAFQKCVVDQVKDLSNRYVPDKPKPKINQVFEPRHSDHDVLAVLLATAAAADAPEFRLALDKRFESSRQFDAYNLADYQLESFANEFDALRAAGFDYLLTYGVRRGAGRLSADYTLMDLRSRTAQRKGSAHANVESNDAVTDLSVQVWRAVEGGNYPEASVWRPGVGYCEKILSISVNLPLHRCEDAEWHFGLDKPEEQKGVLRDCLSLWRQGPVSHGMENTCQWTCPRAGAPPEKISLYFRANAEIVSGGSRLSKREKDQIRADLGAIADRYLTERRGDYHDAPAFVAALRRDLESCLVDRNGWTQDSTLFAADRESDGNLVERFGYVRGDSRRAIVLEHSRPMLGESSSEHLQHFYKLHFVSVRE